MVMFPKAGFPDDITAPEGKYLPAKAPQSDPPL
jgi:hypothetical protein